MRTESIIVDNLHCGGCASNIQKKLSEISGVEKVDVDLQSVTVSILLNADVQRAVFLEKLAGMGYPEQGTGNTIQKMKSYVSCAVGKMNS